MQRTRVFLGATLVTLAGAGAAVAENKDFGQTVEFLHQHTPILVLGSDPAGPRVAVAPGWQGRVMTSSARGDRGPGNGWVNFEFIESGKRDPQFNAFGGEDRLWIGPEGGQFSIYFKPGDAFEFKNWKTPDVIDTEPFEVVKQDDTSVELRKPTRLENYSRTQFSLEIGRAVRLLSAATVAEHLGVALPEGVRVVAYESENSLRNMGPSAWSKKSGLLSIWILGCLTPAPDATVVIPFQTGPAEINGPIVNDAYFGKVPAERLVIDEKAGVLFFKADGKHRAKIGLGPRRARNVAGSYAPSAGRLTLVQYNKPANMTDYVNSMWELQANPYGGDVINSYNDGPTSPGGKPLGPFYELESSSAAYELKPGEAVTHISRTIHIEGTPAQLDPIARKVLGVPLEQVTKALK